MKCAHLIKLSVFSYEQENKDSILEAFLKFFPFNLKDSGVQLNKTVAEGFNEAKIEIFETNLAKNSLINQFLANLLKNLDKNQKNLIIGQAESRLDKNLDFFLRFDKDPWINEKKLLLTDSGRCFHLKISVAAFPKKRELALNAIKNLFFDKPNK